MKVFDELDDDNFVLFAMNNYNNRQCTSTEEFYDDLNRFKYIKRLLSRYQQDGVIQERLLINHIVVFHNIFGIKAANKMLWYKIEEKHWPVIKTVLLFLNFIPDTEKIEIPLDSHMVEKLRKI